MIISYTPLWHYVLVALASYLLAELVIFAEPKIPFIESLYLFGGITSYNLNPARQHELAIHFIVQTASIPAYLTLNHQAIKRILSRKGCFSFKDIISGAAAGILIAWLLYAPAKSGENISLPRLDAIEYLVSHWNFAYAISTSALIFSALLCLQVATSPLIKFTRL